MFSVIHWSALLRIFGSTRMIPQLPIRIDGRIGRTPQVARGMGAMRGPSGPVFGQLFRGRQTALSVCDLKAPPHAEVVNRQDIRSAEIENEKHFHGPPSNALDFG